MSNLCFPLQHLQLRRQRVWVEAQHRVRARHAVDVEGGHQVVDLPRASKSA